MYPIHTHLIKYKNTYLGKNNAVFGFMKEGHAKRVVEKLKYCTPVIQVSPCSFVINRPPHHKTNVVKHCIDKRYIEVQTFQTSVGNFFASINNMELKVIDQVLVNKMNDAIVLKSEFALEEIMPLEETDMVQHLEDLFSEDTIDYQEKMSEIIVDRYILETDDDDLFE